MIQTPKERQEWHDLCQARFATPDVENRQVVGERTFVRTLGKHCPWCGHVFFAYQVEGEEREPYKVDPNPLAGRGLRETCGNPQCREAEDDYQFKRRQEFRAARMPMQVAS